MMIENHKLSINVEHSYIHDFIKEQSKCSHKAIVVSAGPSLELSIEEIKKE